MWIWAALFTVGCVHLVLALWHGPEPLEALKIFAFNYLTGFLLIGITVRALREDFLAWLCRYLPWVNAAVIITFKLILQNKVGIPFNKIHKIAPPGRHDRDARADDVL